MLSIYRHLVASQIHLTLSILLSLLLALILYLPVQAASINTTSGTGISISGDGSTVIFNRDGNIYASTDSLGSSTLVDSGSTVIGVSKNGSRILGVTALNEYLLYSGTNHQTIRSLSLIPNLSNANLSGISSDGQALFGTFDIAVSPNEGALWVTADDWATNSGVTKYSITYGPASSMPTLNAVSDNINGVRTAVGIWENTPRMWQTPTSGTTLVDTALSLSYSSTTYTMGNAEDITDDASVAVGFVHNASIVAAKWDLISNTLTCLPIEGFNGGYAHAVNNNGTVIVGEVTEAAPNAAIWTGSGTSYTLQTLYDALTNKGVSLNSPWYLRIATGVNDDGTLIIGSTDTGEYFIANLAAGGVITTDELNQSLASMGQVGPAVSGMGQLSMSRLGGVAGGQGLRLSMTNPSTGTAGTGTQRGLSSGDEMPGRLDLWVIGSVGSNSELNGDDIGLHGGVGLSWDNGNEWRFGGGVFGDTRDLNTSHGGDQSIRAIGPGVFAVYTPDGTGLEFRVSALWQSVALDLTRGYANGAGSASSSGDTDANVFGLSGRVQWTRNMNDYLALTPFAEYTWQNTHIDSYSESGGPFPASFKSRSETSNSIRTGLRADIALFDKVGTWAWLAWDHRFEGTSSGMGGTSTGLGAFSYPGTKLDQDWADAGVGASWDITNRLSATSSLGVVVGCDDDTAPDLTATMGLNYQIW